MLQNKEIATLANKLQVPVVVSDILDGRDELSDDIQYGLHEIISDLQPDSALLAIAVSALKIAKIYEKASPAMTVLVMECERLMQDYGPLWLQNANNENLDHGDIFDILSLIPEDLEGLAELLSHNITFLRTKDEQAAALCNILYIQASAHAMVAETFIEAAHEAATPQPAIAPAILADNVVQFPKIQIRTLYS